MTPTRNSYDPQFFPEPEKFAPERWLQSEETVAAMNRVFMPFAYGRRGCLGMQYVFGFNTLTSVVSISTDTVIECSFAQAELRTALGCLFRRFEFELFDTIRKRDIDHTWAHISGEPNKKGRGLRFKVVKVY